MALVYVNGSMVEEAEATLSVFDHGLVVGDGLFETILVHRGRPFALERHLDRLEATAAGLRLRPPNRAALRDGVQRVVAASGLDRARVRLTVTSGRGPLGSTRGGGDPGVVIAAAPESLSEEGARVVVAPWTRNETGALCGLKTTSYAENAVALVDAMERGASEAIFANTRGSLCEGTGSNVFVVLGGVLVTPTLGSGCLAGITRALVLEHGGGEERDIPVDDLRPGRASEAFLTSTLRGVQPILAVDDVHYGGPGPVGAEMGAIYAALLETNPEP